MTQPVRIFVIPHDSQCILGLTAILKKETCGNVQFWFDFWPIFHNPPLLPLHFVSKIMEIDLLKCANICVSE